MPRFSLSDLSLSLACFGLAAATTSALWSHTAFAPPVILLMIGGISGGLIGVGFGALVGRPATCAAIGFIFYPVLLILAAHLFS